MEKSCQNISCHCTDFNRHLCKWYRAEKIRVKKGLNRTSPKREEQEKQYNSLARKFKAENPLCKANLKGCERLTRDVHHKAGRGVNLLNVDTWLPVCRNCHDMIHKFPELSRQVGLMEKRG